MTPDFKKNLLLGTIKTNENKHISVYVFVKYVNNRLSIRGVEGPLISGNCLGSCGQINMHLDASEINLALDWTKDSAAKLWAIWNRWHLNDLQPGDPAQMDWLRANPDTTEDYLERKAALKAAGLGDHYGTKWWREEVPADVLNWLRGLPERKCPGPWGA